MPCVALRISLTGNSGVLSLPGAAICSTANSTPSNTRPILNDFPDSLNIDASTTTS